MTDFDGNYSAWVEKLKSNEKRAKDEAAGASKAKKR
jgi:hypothetical protein